MASKATQGHTAEPAPLRVLRLRPGLLAAVVAACAPASVEPPPPPFLAPEAVDSLLCAVQGALPETGPRAVIVGEDHADHAIPELLSALMRRTREPGAPCPVPFDCLLFEIDAPRQPALDQFLATGDRAGLDAFPAPDGWVDDHLLPTLTTARALGVPAWAVDHPESPVWARDIRPFATAASMGLLVDPVAEAKFSTRMLARNQHMAARAAELTATCALPWLITGRWHALPDASRDASTVTAELRTLGVPTVALGVTGLPALAPRQAAISRRAAADFDVWIGETDVPPYHLQITPPHVEVVTLRARPGEERDANLWANLSLHGQSQTIELELPPAPKSVSAHFDNGCAVRIARSEQLSRDGVPITWQVGGWYFYANQAGAPAEAVATWTPSLREEVARPRRYTTANRTNDDGSVCLVRLLLLP